MKKSPITAASALIVVTALLSGLTSSVAGASGTGSQPSDASPGTVIPGTDCPAFPADDVWNTNISGLPVNPNSATLLASMDSSTTNLHPDFGPSGDPTNPYGIPYTVVSPSHPLVNIAFDYA